MRKYEEIEAQTKLKELMYELYTIERNLPTLFERVNVGKAILLIEKAIEKGEE